MVRGGPTAPEQVKRSLHLEGEEFDVQPLASSRGGLVIQFGSESKEAKSRWRKVQDQLGGDAVVSPVMEDSGGEAHYPTGEITVRFAAAPDEAAVGRLIDAFDLEVAGRNRWVPSQITFRRRHPRGAYLPELIEAIAAATGVRAAWAGTESKLERGS